MATSRPQIVLLAGPNGAGKTTASRDLLQGAFAVHEFVNADVIATGLSGFQPEAAAIAAGRIMLLRLRELAAEHLDFAFETTLASRSFAPWLREQRGAGYRVHVTFLALPSADLAVQRVADRVRRGGHDVPEAVIRRRYEGGLRNFHGLYRDIATSWQLIDNEMLSEPILVAEEVGDGPAVILDGERWTRLDRT
jgi:predicted ABC-type ATPase